MATTMLVCKQCNFENEPERVYCHNCGAKLDRSLLPPEASKREDPVIVQERVRKMVKPRNVSLIDQLKNFIYCVLLSAALAAVVLIFKPPQDVVDISPEAAMDALTIPDDLDADLQLPAPRRRPYTEAQINAWLAGNLKPKKVEQAGSIPAVSFKNAYVHLNEGSVALTMADSLFGLPIYATTVRTLGTANGALASRPLGGSLGRLPIPAAAMPVFEYLFEPLKKAADHPLKTMAAMQSVTVHKGTVEFVTPGHR